MKKLLLCVFLFLPVASLGAGGWDAAWSPDGKSIAFTSGAPMGVPNIWIMSSDGKDLRKLTSMGGRAPQWLARSGKLVFVTLRSGKPAYMAIDPTAASPAESAVPGVPADAQGVVWSRDGSQIAYALPGKDPKSRDLWVATADGSKARGVTTNFWVRQYAWNPDGKQLAVVIGSTIGSSLWIVKPETKSIKMFYDGFCSSPSYSPDGKYLVFAVPALKEGHRVTCIEVATGKRIVIPVKFYDGQPVRWSRDSRRMVFSSETRSEVTVWIAGVDGKMLVRVTPPEIQAFDPSFSPDGKRIVFSATTADSQGIDLYTCPSDVSIPFGVLKQKSDLSRYARLTRSNPSQFSPMLSPDGKRVAFGEIDKGMTAIYTASSRIFPGRRKLLDFDPAWKPAIAWSPDGKMIAVGADGKLRVFGADGGQARVTLTCGGETTVQWSLDSKSIYFSEWKAGKAGVSVYDLDASETRQLTKGTERAPTDQPKDEKPAAVVGAHSHLTVAGPVETDAPVQGPTLISDLYPAASPDGKTVAFVREGQIWLIGADGKTERQLTKLPAPDKRTSELYSPSWSPDGSRILFLAGVSGPSGLVWEIWTIDPVSGEARKVISQTPGSEYGCNVLSYSAPPQFTDDGKRIIFTSVEGTGCVATIALDGSDLKPLSQSPSVFGSTAAGKVACVNFARDEETVAVAGVEN